MKSLKQITKQIETSNKRISDYKAKIEKYSERSIKALDKLKKAAGIDSLTLDNFEAVLKEEFYSKDDFSVFNAECSVSNAIEYRQDNEKNLRIELKNLDRLQAEKAEIENQSQKYCKSLEIALGDAMNGFKLSWFARMLDWYRQHFNHIQEILPLARKNYKRADYIAGRYICDSRHKRRYNLASDIRKAYAEVIRDDAARYTTDQIVDYLEKVKKDLETSWTNGIVKLTTKCQGFGVDEDRIKISYPAVTSKGFEAVITDGKPREIFARIIWAAEGSIYVQPHTRYIVTERTY